MESNIGDVAKALDLSPQAIRLYEEKGILRCQRNEESGYRIFDRENITALLRSRLLRSFGFTMSEIASMLNELDAEQTLERYRTREDQLEAEIAYLQSVKSYLHHLESQTRKAVELDGRCEVGLSPAYYLLPFMEGLHDKHKLNAKVIRTWNELYPFRWDTTFIDLATMSTTEMKYRVAAVIAEPSIERLPPEARVGLLFQPAQQTVTAWFSREKSTHIPLQTSLAFALRFIEEQGLRLCGDVAVSAMLLLTRDTSRRAYFMASLPVC